MHIPVSIPPPPHPHAAAQFELAEVKQLYQAQIIKKEKLKQKPEESQTSFVKVCSLLHGHFIFSAHVFTDQVGSSLISLCIFYFVWFKVSATSCHPAIEADYLPETEGMFVVVHMDVFVG